MITPNELRIGNRVLVNRSYDDEPWETTVEEIEEMQITAAIDPRGGTWVKYEDIDPIPLTPVWLERSGFKRGSQPSDRNVFYPTGAHKINIEISGKDEYSYLLDGNLIKGYARIKYVHQLQNLYWCLCGQELPMIR